MRLGHSHRKSRGRSRINRVKGRSFLRVNTTAKDGRAARRRMLKGLLILAGLVCVAFLFKLGVDLAAVIFVRENELFRIRAYDVRCHGNVIKPEHVMDYASLDSHSNLFAVDIAGVRRRLLSTVPRLKSIEVSRKLNGTLMVEIWEREPIARLFGNGYYVVVDEEGCVLGPAAGPSSLPIIAGVIPPGLKPGVFLSETPIRNALEVLRVCATTPIGRAVSVARIDIRSDKTLHLRLDNGAIATIAWSGMGEQTKTSRENLENKLLRLAENLIEADRRGDRIVEIDMTGERSFPARCARKD